MISARSNVRQAQDQLTAIRQSMAGALDQGIESGLDDLIAAVVPVTPVVSGDMSRGYRAEQHGAGHWSFLNIMPYSGKVIGLPQHTALRSVLDNAETTLEATLDVLVTRVVGR